MTILQPIDTDTQALVSLFTRFVIPVATTLFLTILLCRFQVFRQKRKIIVAYISVYLILLFAWGGLINLWKRFIERL